MSCTCLCVVRVVYMCCMQLVGVWSAVCMRVLVGACMQFGCDGCAWIIVLLLCVDVVGMK